MILVAWEFGRHQHDHAGSAAAYSEVHGTFRNLVTSGHVLHD